MLYVPLAKAAVAPTLASPSPCSATRPSLAVVSMIETERAARRARVIRVAPSSRRHVSAKAPSRERAAYNTPYSRSDRHARSLPYTEALPIPLDAPALAPFVHGRPDPGGDDRGVSGSYQFVLEPGEDQGRRFARLQPVQDFESMSGLTLQRGHPGWRSPLIFTLPMVAHRLPVRLRIPGRVRPARNTAPHPEVRPTTPSSPSRFRRGQNGGGDSAPGVAENKSGNSVPGGAAQLPREHGDEGSGHAQPLRRYPIISNRTGPGPPPGMRC